MENKQKELKIEDLENVDITRLPITTSTFAWTPTGILLSIILHVLSFMMSSVMILTYFIDALKSDFFHWRLYFIAIDVLAWWGSYILSNLLFCKLALIILKLIHKPKEGLFKMDKKDRDYYFYCLRVTVKKQVFWVWNNFCFPWVANFAFKMCDMRADFKSTMFDGWSDVEFIEFGNNMMLGQGAVVLSSIIIGDYLLLKKVTIGDHVVLGGNCVVAPGTVIGKGTTLGIWTVTHINQVLEPDWIYLGRPARKFVPANKMIEESKSEPMRRIVDTGERIPFDVQDFKERTEKKLD